MIEIVKDMRHEKSVSFLPQQIIALWAELQSVFYIKNIFQCND